MLFCFNQKKTVAETEQIICATYGEDVVNTQFCETWFKRFRAGGFNIKNITRITRANSESESDEELETNPSTIAIGIGNDNNRVISHWLKPVAGTFTLKKIKETTFDHPPISTMVTTAIEELDDSKGSSFQAIKKFIIANYEVDETKLTNSIKRYLKTAVSNGKIIQTTGKGAQGSFKLSSINSSNSSNAKKNRVIKKKKTSKESDKNTGSLQVQLESIKTRIVPFEEAQYAKILEERRKSKARKPKVSGGVTKKKNTKNVAQQKVVSKARKSMIKTNSPKLKKAKKVIAKKK